MGMSVALKRMKRKWRGCVHTSPPRILLRYRMDSTGCMDMPDQGPGFLLAWWSLWKGA
jgi:hypothetical protein